MKAEISKGGILKIDADTVTEAYAIDCWADSLISEIEARPENARKLLNQAVRNVGWANG